MTEWLKIIYDIMAGLGFLIVFVITVAFTWGIFLSFSSKRAKKKQEAEDALLSRVAPELRRSKLKEMLAAAEKNIEDINAQAEAMDEAGRNVIEKLAGKKIKAGEENQTGG